MLFYSFVLGSQNLLIIRLGVAEVISAVTLYHLPALQISTSLDMFSHNNFACGMCSWIVALIATMCLYNVSGGDQLIKRKKKSKIHQYPTFTDQYLPTLHSMIMVQQNSTKEYSISEFRLCNRSGNSEHDK